LKTAGGGRYLLIANNNDKPDLFRIRPQEAIGAVGSQ